MSATPVPAVGLEELGVDPRDFARRLLAAYAEDMVGIEKARHKVREVP